jgi:hypothetical protein
VSRRSNHTTMGLAFILGCLVIAFGIYLGLKSSQSVTANAAGTTSGNVQAADVANGSDALPDPGPPPDPENSDDNSPVAAPVSNAEAANAASGPLMSHDDFYLTCVGAEGAGFDGVDDGEKPAMCECMYSRVASYGSMTRENAQLALKMCRLQWVMDRQRFDRTYAPNSPNPAGSASQPDASSGQANDEGQP